MFTEDDLLPISALQHLLFCERQAALIHLERLWAENRLTVEGLHLHRRAHEERGGWTAGTWIERRLSLRSFELGLAGQADVVEFVPPSGIAPQAAGPVFTFDRDRTYWANWQVTPVEYKRGKPKKDDCDRVQLTAQAICLEEMLGVVIAEGAIFYGRRRRRTPIAFDGKLRSKARDAADRMHALFSSGRTPSARREPKCDNCSLLELCLPAAVGRGAHVARFVQNAIRAHLAASAPGDESGIGD